MRILAIDALGSEISAFADDGSGGPSAFRSAALRADRLLDVIDDARRGCGWTWLRIEAIAVSVGPGGFTGLRTSVAAARALALAVPCGAIAVSTFEALAAGVASGVCPTVVVGGSRDSVFLQSFGSDAAPSSPPRTLSAAALHDALQEMPPGLLVMPAGLRQHLGLQGTTCVEIELNARYVAQAARRRLGRGERPVKGTELQPLYLREPDARRDAGRPLVGSES